MEQKNWNERANRLWQYRIQEENIFYQRINFFLVAESMLFVAFVTGIANDLKIIVIVMGILGALLTIVWGYVNWRQKCVYEHLRTYVEDACPEYKEVRETRPKALSSWLIMTYIIPVIMLAAWIALLRLA